MAVLVVVVMLVVGKVEGEESTLHHRLECLTITSTVESEVVAEAAVAAARAAKAAVAVTAEVEDVEVGSVIVLIEFATIMVVQAVMVVMEAAEEEVLDMSGMEIMLSQHTLALVEAEEQAEQAVILEQVAVEVMAVTVVMEEDLNQTVLKVVLVKAVVKVEEMNRVADTMEEIAMVKVAKAVEEAAVVLPNSQPVIMEV